MTVIFVEFIDPLIDYPINRASPNSDTVECWPVMQAAWVQSQAAALVIKIFSIITSGAQGKKPYLMGLVAWHWVVAQIKN